MRFKKYLEEETTAGDIATVDVKLDMAQRYERHKEKGKRCKKHKKYDCEICEEQKWDDE